jgi:RNA polymerase sigma factor (sigma-70 family)
MRQILPGKLHTEADVEAGAHKDLFLRYYQQLFRLALRLTDGSRARAEDLLHDAFIHFVLSRPDLNSIDNFDRYLYRLLLNLFRRQKRKAAQMQDISFNIADYDSATLGLHAIDFQARWQAQEDLLRICHYACVRKETSRAGSVLILRFFYDYSPSEIAKVTLSPRGAVDDWLRLARREARFYLEDPERLKFMAGKQGESYRFKTKSIKPSDDIVYELRASILRSGRSDCLSETQLHALYQESGQAEKTLDCATLGHIVSCACCLDRVNHLLGLPLLSTRQAIEKGRSEPDEPDESDKGDGSGTGAGSEPSKAFIDRGEEQIRQIREHRPEELLFSANGDPIGALKINSQLSELRLSIHDQSPLEFIEVYSERGMMLILFFLEPGENAPVEQRTKLELSEGRTLELIFKLGGTRPSLRVIYRDPLLQEIDYALNDEPIGALALVCDAGPLSDGVGSVRLEAEANVAAHTADAGSERLITWLSRRLRGLRLRQRRSSRLTMLSISSESQTAHGEPRAQTTTEPANATGSEDPRLKELRVFELGRAEDLIRGPLWRRPGFITVIFSVLLIFALLYLWLPGATTVNASGLLERASSAEEKIDRDPNIVQHRTLDLEERKPGDGRVISRSRVEVWHSGARGITARRLYDQKNRLIAGEWTMTDGTRKVYRQKGGDLKRNLDVWQLDLSAREFSTLIKQVDVAKVEETAQTYVIRYQSAELRLILPSAELTKATITLSKQDLHTIEQTLLIEQASETREFRLSETSYEQHTVSEVSPSVFEPERELFGSNGEPRRRDESTTISSPPSHAPVPPSPATAELEVEVLSLLNNVRADLGEPITVKRLPDGTLQVEALIETAQRKAEILSVLRPVIDHPAIKLNISTVAEALLRQQLQSVEPPGRTIFRELTVTSSKLPVDADLRYYFTHVENRASSDEEIDQAIRRFSAQMLDRSSAAANHALALHRLSKRFSPGQLRSLATSARDKWRAMIYSHSRVIARESAAMRHDLQLILPGPGQKESEPEQGAVAAIINDDALNQAIGRLFELSVANQKAINAAFTLSNEKATATTIKELQFLLALKQVERLATVIQDYSSL